MKLNKEKPQPDVEAPRQNTGHWYKSSCDICYTCSFCGVTNASGTKYNYCPNCGARMEVKENDTY